MAGDGILSIGATVDKTGVDAGLTSIQEGFQSTTQKIAVQVEETCAKTKAAWTKLSADVKAGAASVSAEAVRLAEATKAQTAAYADLNRAKVLAKDANLSEEESTRILASAQTELASATAEVAQAKQAQAEAVEAANLREGLSENLLVAQFQLAGREIAANFAAMKERMVLGAREGSFEIRDLATAFTGVGEAIAAVVAAGIAVHFVDDLAKMNVELDHLSVETRMSITNLAGLQEIVKDSGVDWDEASVGIVRMTKNLAASGDQFKEMKMAVAGIGLSLEALQGMSPEEQLQKIAVAFANTSNEGNVANAAIEIFGRGGKVLIPILKEQGAELDANMKKMGDLTGVTDKSAAAARRWTEDMAKLSMQWRSVMMPVMENIENVVMGIVGVWDAAAALLESVIDGVGAAVTALAQEFFYLGKTIFDALHFNVSSLQEDIQKVMHSGVDTLKQEGSHLGGEWKKVFSDFTGISMDAINGKVESLADQLSPPAAPGLPAGYDAGGKTGSGAGAGGSADGGAVGQEQGAYNPLVSNMSQIQGAMDAVQRQQQDLADASAVSAQQAGQAWRSQMILPIQSFAAQMPQVTLKVVTATQQLAQGMTKAMQQAFQKMAEGFNQVVSRWIIEGGHFRQMMQQTINQVATHFLQQTMQMTEQWAKHELMKVGQHQVAQAQITATDAAGAAQGVAIQKGADTQTNLAAAKTAAKNTYKVVSGWPVVGPILAPIMAAGAFAAVEAFEQGGIVGGGRGMAVPILAHAGERVLSSQQTTNFEKLVNQSSTSSTSITNHFHDNSNYSAIDGASVSSMVRSHGREWRREAMRQMRLSNAI